MRVYLDITGGDNAPEAPVLGALEALDIYKDLTVVLGGPIEVAQELLKNKEYDKSRIEFDDARETIDNNESPTMAIRKKKDSAIVKGLLAVKDKSVDAFVSSGSTGAVLAGGMFRLGRIKGIERPAIAPLMPNGKGFFLLIDGGANVDCKPLYLQQFALMGSAYMKGVMNIESPKVGLLNIGAEEEKGNELTKTVYPLLKQMPINFIGNIEGRYATAGIADVVVADGFAGNLLLKLMEGMASTILGMLKKELTADTRSKIGALLAKPAFKRVKLAMDYTEVGGAPLLGCDGVVIKSHGSNNAHAMASAIKQAVKMIQSDVPNLIAKSIEEFNAEA